MATLDPHSLLRRNTELSILRHLAETLNRATDLQVALDDALALIVELLQLQTGWVFLLDHDGSFYLAASQALPPALPPRGTSWQGSCSCNNLFRRGELQEAINIVQCSRLAEADGDRRGLEFHASVPLRSEARVIGILNVASPGSGHFTSDVLELLQAVGYQLGTAIERLRLARQEQHLAALEERTRIARDLHDTVAQGLTAISLHLETAEALANRDPAQVQHHIQTALALARTSLVEVRRSVLDLRAAPLEEHTLAEALAILLQSFKHDTAIATRLRADLPERLSPPLEHGIYRIVQEALSNVRKHAAAGHVVVDVARREGQLELRIEDDGAGFILAAVQQGDTSGFGLRGMNERARLLGGTLEVCSAPGSGTQITASLPLR
jgi:two-component system, NarL family, sensor kinase